ncbi:hypothetical protein Q4595_25715, partial [Wenyingzhuangia sp. 1_MG-2023]|nr:hypothetical protein [Wenyingzhuangia sp. 1_MG-2023]
MKIDSPNPTVNAEQIKAKIESAKQESDEYQSWGMPLEAEEADKRAKRLQGQLDKQLGMAAQVPKV